MPVHSSCVALPFASAPSIVTFVLKGKDSSYFTLLFRPMPFPRCDFLAFNFHVPSNALPKQTAPAATQTAKNTKVVLNFMAQIKPGIRFPVNLFVNRGLRGFIGSGSACDSSAMPVRLGPTAPSPSRTFSFTTSTCRHWLLAFELPFILSGIEMTFRFADESVVVDLPKFVAADANTISSSARYGVRSDQSPMKRDCISARLEFVERHN